MYLDLASFFRFVLDSPPPPMQFIIILRYIWLNGNSNRLRYGAQELGPQFKKRE